MTVLLIIMATAAAAAGVYLFVGKRKPVGVTVTIPDHELPVRKAVKPLPVIDETDTGRNPCATAELSPDEAALIGSEPDCLEGVLETTDRKKELAELGYVIAEPAKDDETMIDPFEDGRCFFPAPETAVVEGELISTDNQ